MKLDNTYKVPPGFKPHLNYPDGKTGIPVVDLAIDITTSILFYIAKQVPALPIKGHGEIEHMGWDIPTRWAIDSENICWMDGAHGGSLHPVSRKTLLSETDEYSDKKTISELLGVKFREPEWAVIARRNGWLPPEEVKKLNDKVDLFKDLMSGLGISIGSEKIS